MISTVEGSEGTINDNVNYSGAKVERGCEGGETVGAEGEGRVRECRERERDELGGGRMSRERVDKREYRKRSWQSK